MIKLFVTGDVHIGKKYDRYPEIRDQLIRSRFDCLARCVKKAEEEHCDFIIITGDLFDNVGTTAKRDVREVVDILSEFGGRVVVLPGNHDYYTGEEKVWKDFTGRMGEADHNITLVTEFRELTFEIGEETVTFYPAFCQSKHSGTNNLGWIRNTVPDGATYHIGLAHGSIEGLSPDMKNEYFLMSERELNAIPMDAWLIGHTHIPYPADLPVDKDVAGYTIFNAGTPEQTDLSNNTSGVCFIVSVQKEGEKAIVSAKSVQTGAIRFFDMATSVRDRDLRKTILAAEGSLPENAVIRFVISGSIPEEQYHERAQIYEETLGRFLTFEVVDTELSELITPERIRSEFAEIGFASQLLESLDDPKELQMAYELIKKYQE